MMVTPVLEVAENEKKADVAEHPQVFDHVGLLVNGPAGTSRVALHLVIRPLHLSEFNNLLNP